VSEPSVSVNEYIVSMWPDGVDSINRSVWDVHVQRRSSDKWAVVRLGQVLNKNGRWLYDPTPSSRTEKHLASTRFPLDVALDLARKAAPHVVVNGMTPTDVLAHEARHQEEL
jgi:hypothetical protein